MVDFDKILDRIGPFGRYQIYIYILLGLAGLQTGVHNLASVFIGGLPDTWCHVDELSALEASTQRTLLKSSAASAENGNGHSMCYIYDVNYTSVRNDYVENVTFSVPNGTAEIPCSKWNYDDSVFELTIVNQV